LVKSSEIQLPDTGKQHITVTTIKDNLWIGCTICNKAQQLTFGDIESMDKYEIVKTSFLEFCKTHFECKKKNKDD